MENNRFLIFIAIYLFTLPAFTNAYSVTTHQELHKNILKEYQHLAGDDIPSTLERAFIKGAVDEDKGARPVNHFYDSINNVGLKNNKRPKSIIWATNPYLQGRFGEWRLIKDKEAKLLEHESDYSWQRAVYEYVHGDKERAMESLGHIMHLLEDLTSVPHTRDDAHSGSWFDGHSYYEDYTVDKVPHVQLPNLKEVNDIKTTFKGLSTYTNTHYLSADTIFKKYLSPQKNNLIRKGDYLYDPIIGNKVLWSITLIDKNGNTTEEIKLQEPQVMQSYWDHLSYKAVESGVATMDLFFREVAKERLTNELAYMNKSYGEVKSIASTIKSYKGMRSLLGSSLSAVEAYELNENEWEGARRAAEMYGIDDFPPRPIGVKMPKLKPKVQAPPTLPVATEVFGPMPEAPSPAVVIEQTLEDPKPVTVVINQEQQLGAALIALEQLVRLVKPPQVEKGTDACAGIDLAILKYSTCLSPFEEGGYAYGGGGSGSGSASSSAPPVGDAPAGGPPGCAGCLF